MMNVKKVISVFKKKIKEINSKKNYLLNKQYIPDILNSINIEVTNICNLKCKFCAYDKRDLNKVPLKTMDMNLFKNVTNQCIKLGYKNFGLTPVTGDIFMDKDVEEKIKYLENLDGLNGYYFYTNFIPIKEEKISNLFNYKKLTHLGLSIYGHDESTFIKFSKGTTNSYRILLKNLDFLYSKLKTHDYEFQIEIGHRTSKDYSLDASSSDLSLVLKKLRSLKNVVYDKNHSFNNWGGMIQENDVADLNIKFQKGLTKKNGSCSLIYSRLSIGANGVVNACACRDANFSLQIGNASNENLSNIISYNNKRYSDLIESQEKNNFPSVCESCDFYKSIYEKTFPTWAFKKKRVEYQSLNEVVDRLKKRQI